MSQKQTFMAADAPPASEIAQRLSQLVRIPTVTPVGAEALTPAEAQVFTAYRALLEQFYPLTFGGASIDVVGRMGLLLHVAGASSERPMVLMAHQDVVPTNADWQRDGWRHEPYAGVIEDGIVYGRGTIDDKGPMVVMLEAVESLLAQGWRPAQDLYLLMGADEESYGECAVAATALLESRGVTPFIVVDEGGAVALEAIAGVEGELAIVGVSEKGLTSIRLEVTDAGGHASMPPKTTAAGVLARALVAVESNPFPAQLNDVTVELLRTVGPQMTGVRGWAMRNAHRLRGLLARVLPGMSAEMAALVRTTAAITKLSGSPADNVLATRASAIINCRIAVGSSVAETRNYLEKVINNPRVSVDVMAGSEPSPISPRGNDSRWLAIGQAIAASYPEATQVPYVMLAASDSRHVARIAPAVYRFAPLRMNRAQRGSVHGIDEHVEVESLGRGVVFYRALLISGGGA